MKKEQEKTSLDEELIIGEGEEREENAYSIELKKQIKTKSYLKKFLK